METVIRKYIVGVVVLLAVFAVLGLFLYGLAPTGSGGANHPVVFEIKQGQGFREIVGGLRAADLVRSSFATEIFALLTGSARSMQPGIYKLDPGMSTPEIVREITSGAAREVTVVVPEGSNIYQIDTILADALVLHAGDLVSFKGTSTTPQTAADLEGRLFPDTYRFFVGSDVQVVVQKFLDNFDQKAAPLLAKDEKNVGRNLIVASLVDKEVPDPNDQKIVAGIILKRLQAGMPLNIDATVCYAELVARPGSGPDCGSLTSLDLKIQSPYNTYLYKGLPPSPIGNPGISALSAAMDPESSPYWFYLSDPATGKTIFAKTLDEQHANTVKYLKGT
jgi:UPF0755 protein